MEPVRRCQARERRDAHWRARCDAFQHVVEDTLTWASGYTNRGLRILQRDAQAFKWVDVAVPGIPCPICYGAATESPILTSRMVLPDSETGETEKRLMPCSPVSFARYLMLCQYGPLFSTTAWGLVVSGTDGAVPFWAQGFDGCIEMNIMTLAKEYGPEKLVAPPVTFRVPNRRKKTEEKKRGKKGGKERQKKKKREKKLLSAC
eukprot:1005451-Rhodomonas_salina.1